MRLAAVTLMAVGLTFAPEPPSKEAPQAATNAPEHKPQEERLRQELLRRMQADQEARKGILALMHQSQAVDLEALPKVDLPALKRLRETDRRNTERIRQLVQRYGWPGKALVGTDGAHAAWLLVQHADHDRPFQKRCLGLLKEAVRRGEASGEELAYLTDRILVGENSKQLYGTQLRQVDGKYRPFAIEDEAHVDRRRREVGLPPLAESLRLAGGALRQATEGKR
jgi:hypothetical protein